MDELHREADKLTTEVDHLNRILAGESPHQVDLALSVAKRVRRSANLVVRAAARLRDNQSQP